MTAKRYLLWDIEHRGWWRPGHCGYTSLTDEAGRYDREEAMDVCADANLSLGHAVIPVHVTAAERFRRSAKDRCLTTVSAALAS